jgi:glycosyltransferase involved in cell wall biosynthesis
MSDHTQVSVIMPFLNMETFLTEAIESVRAQTFAGWELLLCDDGSTDGSTATARQYAARFPEEIRYLEHPGHRNRGASAARNLGLHAARGELIALLDADDVWLPNKLEEQVPILQAHPEAAMLYGDTQLWFSWTGHADDRARDYVPPHGLEPNRLYHPPTLIVPYFLRREVLTPCTCSVLLRRDAALRVGGFEASFRSIYTDQAFYAKLCLVSSVYVAEGCWARYRQHKDSAYQTVKRTGRRYEARRVFLKWLEEYLAQEGKENEEIRRELRAELRSDRLPILWRLANKARNAVSGKALQVVKKVRRLRKRFASHSLPLRKQQR